MDKKGQKSYTTIRRQVIYGQTPNILVCPICKKVRELCMIVQILNK
jgi:hypothetical protein